MPSITIQPLPVSTHACCDYCSVLSGRLLAGRAGAPARLGASAPLRIIAFCVAAMGSWREPLQAVYTGIKLPLAILLTALGNGLLNGILAPLLGLNISFRQSLMMVLVGLALTSVVLGSFSPIALFVVWNTPLPTSY